MSILNVEHVSHGFGGRTIFEDASFRLLKGEHLESVPIRRKILQKSEKMSTCRLSELLREIIRIAKCTLHQR